ncbi:MAG: DNA replication/repair protein RecF, partial [Acidimicrobiales bacterium]
LGFVDITNVRCVERAELELHPEQNLIWGGNGSGKTSLLEAIYLVGRGRSFRTRNTERVIRRGAERLVVFGRTVEPEGTVGLQAERGNPTIGKVGGAAVSSLAELSQVLPVQVIDPSIHKLVEEGAPRRRRWMDWAVFHVEQGFVENWTRYQRALQQRNAALRRAPAQAAAWDPELVRVGEALAESRRRSLERLSPYWEETVQALVGRAVTLSYSQGWNRERPLADALHDSLARDLAQGVTHFGPHRADVHLRIDGTPAREIASRGQQKMIAVSMILAQLRMLRETFATSPTLLIDDPAAELDDAHLSVFIDQVRRLSCQLVLTSLGPDPGIFRAPERRFHVEQGWVSPL